MPSRIFWRRCRDLNSGAGIADLLHFELFAFKSFDVTLCVSMSNSGSAESLDFTGFYGF